MSAPRIEPVVFPNRRGQQLFGILHHPARERASGVAVLLLSPGVKMRVAPHRLYNKLADRFVEMGLTVLRFDFHGLGDSEGDAPEATLADFYRATQLGRYVDDTRAAMDWMQQRHGVARFVAAGLCGGCLTGLLTAEHDRRIESLLGFSIPVILDGSGVDAARFMTSTQLQDTRTAYLRRLRFWEKDARESWMRLLTGKSDARLLVRSLTAPLAAVWRRIRPAPPEAAAAPNDNTNPRFAPAFFSMVSNGRPVRLVFAGSDRLLAEWNEKFAARHRAQLARYAGTYGVHVIRDANHIFSFPEWQEELYRECCRALADLVPRDAREAAAAR